jgi:four helix bundle protein
MTERRMKDDGMKDEVRTDVAVEPRGSAARERDLRVRTKSFALRVIKVYTSLPNSTLAQVLGRQLLRSGTSVGAHYREAFRSRSSAEFVSKIEVGLQELEEAKYWLELLIEARIVPAKRMATLCSEAEELTAILTSAALTTKRRKG